MREALRESAKPILDALHCAALAGDVRASKILLSRCLPELRRGDDPIALPNAAGTLAQQAQCIMGELLGGRLTPGQANDLLGSLTVVARIKGSR